jgi:lysophospholipase L1-like esterase
MQNSRWRSRFATLAKVVVINAVVFVVFILFLEAAVRLFVPEVQPLGEDKRLFVRERYGTSHGYAANAQGHTLDAEFVTGESGLRIEPGQEYRNDGRTILFVGDSVAVGFGVEASDALPHILDRRLDDHRFINAAASAYNARDYVNVLTALLPTIRPEGVIVGLCLNDFDLNYRFELDPDFVPQPPGTRQSATPVPEWIRYINYYVFDFNQVLRRHSRLYVWLKGKAFDASSNVFRADRSLYLRPGVESRIAEDIARMKELAASYDAWIEFFVFPYEYQLRPDGPGDLFPQQVIKAAASNAGVKLHDLQPAVAEYLRANGESSESLFLYSDPMHLSPVGAEVVAGLIHDKLAGRLNSDVQSVRKLPVRPQARDPGDPS